MHTELSEIKNVVPYKTLSAKVAIGKFDSFEILSPNVTTKCPQSLGIPGGPTGSWRLISTLPVVSVLIYFLITLTERTAPWSIPHAICIPSTT